MTCNAFCRPRSYELAVKRYDCPWGRPMDQVCCQRTERKPQLPESVVVFIFSTPLHSLDEKFWRKFDLVLLHYLMTLPVCQHCVSVEPWWVSQGHHRCHMDRSGIEPEFLRRCHHNKQNSTVSVSVVATVSVGADRTGM